MITGKMLRDAFISGANNIYNYRQQIDALNVFPVPDGDTGTNMSMTIGNAKRELLNIKDDEGVGEVAQKTASALLRGARGNSGVILSLLFRGFAKGLKDKPTANAEDIANAFEKGVEAAYKAVMKPTEGTILTVARLGAEHAKEITDNGLTACEMWKEIISASTDALNQTPEMLPVLKKAGVVDAGGKGFLTIIEGMYAVINGGDIVYSEEQTSNEKGKVTISEDMGEVITFTYCTEFIIDKNKDADPISLRAYLESIGDCVVVVDDEDIIKCHVHTDNPGNALQAALKLGSLTNIKIDNMREQYGTQNIEENSDEEFPYAPVDPENEFGFVAIAAGEGIKQLFLDLGATNVVSGGQTMNPSTDDILSAIQATPAKNVFVLPNNKNIIMAAEQAINLADRKVFVLQTVTIPQGIAAMLAFDGDQDAKENSATMTKAFENVQTGSITFAARDSEFDGKKIKQGQILALENGKISMVSDDIETSMVKLTASLIKKTHSKEDNFITLIYGEDVTEEDAEAMEALLNEKFGDKAEISLIKGDQPVYYYIISVE